MSPKFTAQFLGNRIVVWDIKQGEALYKNGFYGKPIGVRKPQLDDEFRDPSELSFFEGLYLIEKKKLKILDENGDLLTKKTFHERCLEKYSNFDNKMLVYKHLRKKGYIVRPGLKFGADFAIYIKGPGLEHSPYVVQLIGKDEKLDQIGLVRAGRLATTVGKNLVFASIIKKKTRFFIFTRYKP